MARGAPGKGALANRCGRPTQPRITVSRGLPMLRSTCLAVAVVLLLFAPAPELRGQVKRTFRYFPRAGAPAEANHYRIVTVPLPPEIVLEVGGLAFRDDGKLLACTRRGEVWLI